MVSTSCLDVECSALADWLNFHIKYRWESTANVPGLTVILVSLWEEQETTMVWNAAGYDAEAYLYTTIGWFS